MTENRLFDDIFGWLPGGKVGFQHAGQTDRLRNTLTISTLPTVWDRLAAIFPFAALWNGQVFLDQLFRR